MSQNMQLEVHVRKDESDIGKVYVYDLAGEFLGIAQCHELLGISSAEAATAIKSKVKKFALQQRNENKAHTKHLKGNVADVVLEHRIEQSQNVTALPKAFEEYSTPALEAAGKAAAEKFGQTDADETPSSASEQRLQTELETRLRQPAEVVDIHDTPEHRYARAYHLERQQDISDKDSQWLTVYQQSAEYSSQKQFNEEFGFTPEWSEAK